MAKRKSRGQRSFSQRMSVMRHLSCTDGFKFSAPSDVAEYDGEDLTEEKEGAAAPAAPNPTPKKKETKLTRRRSIRRSGKSDSDGEGGMPEVGMIQFAEDEDMCKVLVGPELEDGSRLIMRTIDTVSVGSRVWSTRVDQWTELEQRGRGGGVGGTDIHTQRSIDREVNVNTSIPPSQLTLIPTLTTSERPAQAARPHHRLRCSPQHPADHVLPQKLA